MSSRMQFYYCLILETNAILGNLFLLLQFDYIIILFDHYQEKIITVNIIQELLCNNTELINYNYTHFAVK